MNWLVQPDDNSLNKICIIGICCSNTCFIQCWSNCELGDPCLTLCSSLFPRG